MIVKIAYAQGYGDLIAKELPSLLKNREDEYHTFKIILYDEDHYKSKKDAIQLKASCGARLLPFCALYNDNKEIVKAFYSEVGECNINNILDFIDNEMI